MTTVISATDLSKSFSLYSSPRDVLKEIVLGGVRHDVFWAVKGLSLEIDEGERVGIIGPNGAGKTTLLRMITGTLTPTSGALTVHGRVSAMLALASFLDPEDTGLANIRFNLLVAGAAPDEIPALTEEIIDFTELGAFIHSPVRTYSAGMNARLAFAISTAVRPDILVIDEVLSVGDASFAVKAQMRMVELANQGRALVVVSHAPNLLQLLCDRAIWMDNGAIRESGPVEEIVRRYEADARRREDETVRSGNRARQAQLAAKVAPREVERPDVARLRVIAPGNRISATHYIRRVDVVLDGVAAHVPLAFADIDDPGVVACLDLVNSQWGRPHVRRGSEARTLAGTSSALRGGHVLVRLADAPSTPVIVTIESSTLGDEPLVVQTADLEAGIWRPLELVERDDLPDGWTRAVFAGEVARLPADSRESQLARLAAELRPDVEIEDVSMDVNGRPALSVPERQPFTIAVRAYAHRPVALLDVVVKIVRADGTYIFWQSSGQVGKNLRDVEGRRTFLFRFDPNVFGAGDYGVTVETSNGFDPEHNWPHSEVYDRRVDALKFTVAREWKLVMHGPVNHRFAVDVEQ